MAYSCPEKRREYGKRWRKENAERMAVVQKRWHENNREKSREASRAWKEANPDRVYQANAKTYSRDILPAVERILSLKDRMNDNQKGRFADWLLKKGHGTLKHFWVDDFVSDFNTRGI